MEDMKETGRAQDNRAETAFNNGYLLSGAHFIIIIIIFFFLMMERALRRHWDFRANPRCCGGEE